MEAVKKDEGALEAGDVAAALRVLAQIARDRTLLAALDADARVALQRLAGEVARPDLKERKKL
ncbi:MAG: oxidoreductase, partial [Myxococcales bacterium]